MTDDPAPLLLRPRQKPGNVHQRDQRNVERVAETDEARGLHGGIDVEHAGKRTRLVADQPDRMAAQAGEPAHHVLCPVLVHLEEVAVVDDAPDDVMHVVRLVRAVGDQRVELGLFPVARIRGLRERRRVHVVLRQERQQVARVLQTSLLVGGDEMRDT